MGKRVYLSPSSQWENQYADGEHVEAAVCRSIARLVKAKLEKRGYEVMTPKKELTYQQRTLKSNAWEARLHIAIHTNAGGGKGSRVFYKGAGGDKKAAAVFARNMAALTGSKNKEPIESSNLYELNHVNSICVYVECEFHDSKKLAKWIVSHKEEIADTLAKSTCEYFGDEY